jgi:hypothetical protein
MEGYIKKGKVMCTKKRNDKISVLTTSLKLPHIWRGKTCAPDAIYHSYTGKERYRRIFHLDSSWIQVEHPLHISLLLPILPEHLAQSSEGTQP